MRTLLELVNWDNFKEISKGCWVPARPEPCCWYHRLKDAWLVFIGRADAFTWPGGQ